MLNQVLVSFGEPAATQRAIAALQADGTCWCGGTVWQGRTAMRISVSSWATTDDDVERSLRGDAARRRAQPDRRWRALGGGATPPTRPPRTLPLEAGALEAGGGAQHGGVAAWQADDLQAQRQAVAIQAGRQ